MDSERLIDDLDRAVQVIINEKNTAILNDKSVVSEHNKRHDIVREGQDALQNRMKLFETCKVLIETIKENVDDVNSIEAKRNLIKKESAINQTKMKELVCLNSPEVDRHYIFSELRYTQYTK